MRDPKRTYRRFSSYSCYQCYKSFAGRALFDEHLPACTEKHKKGVATKPPRTFLQRLASEVNWFTGCRLQQISHHALPVRTMPILRKLEVYNQAVADLQEAIKYNYRCQATQHKEAVTKEETANARL